MSGFEKRMDAEMRFHIEAGRQSYLNQGLSDEEARRRALLDFGAVELAKEEVRGLRSLRWLDEMIRDLRYSLRQLWWSPGFATAVIFTLAVAIGANAAIFSVVQTVWLQPLPYKNPGRLLCLSHSDS